MAVLIDISASMDWGTRRDSSSAPLAGQGSPAQPRSEGARPLTKLDYARYLAACLAYFCHRQRDRVGVATFDREVVDRVPAAGRLDAVLHTIDRLAPGGAGELTTPLGRIAAGLRRRGIVALLSDLYEEPQTVRRAVGQLALAGSDVIVFHLLDPCEVDLADSGAGRLAPRQFEDAESGERIPVVPDSIRHAYRGLVREHIDRTESLLARDRIDYCQVDTAKPLDHALHDFLARRQKLLRRRR